MVSWDWCLRGMDGWMDPIGLEWIIISSSQWLYCWVYWWSEQCYHHRVVLNSNITEQILHCDSCCTACWDLKNSCAINCNSTKNLRKRKRKKVESRAGVKRTWWWRWMQKIDKEDGEKLKVRNIWRDQRELELQNTLYCIHSLLRCQGRWEKPYEITDISTLSLSPCLFTLFAISLLLFPEAICYPSSDFGIKVLPSSSTSHLLPSLFFHYKSLLSL